MLLPCRLLNRRRDAVADIGTILEAYAGGTGYRRAARSLAIPVPTARNWVRRLRGRWWPVVALFDAGPLTADPSPPDAPSAAIRAVRDGADRAGWSSDPWEFLSLRTGGHLLGVANTV